MLLGSTLQLIMQSFVQDNHSQPVGGILWGLLYQRTLAQCKLVRVSPGEVHDVALDLRQS